MDLATVLSAAQTLFAAVHRQDVQDMLSFLGYKSQLEDLQHTVSTVKAVLLDAENKEVHSHQAKLWIEELKDAVYDADDLFDKFLTIVQQKKLIKGGKASKKVSLFFSRYNPFGVAYNMSKGVKKIRKKLDAIAIDHAKFGFKIDQQPIKLRREETCSYVLESNIIGREEDVEKIVEHLLNDTKKQVSYLTIVGIGGLGKTALAQLVYNDARVTSAFPKRIWTCVSDHDQEQLDVEQILRKTLIVAIGENDKVPTNMELLQEKVREALGKQKYLLILDDVWTENRNQWLKLEEFLLGGKEGSWIVLTTRSHGTSRILGADPVKHELQGLSKEKSWCLFKKVAFGHEQSNPSDELVRVGQEIVEGCACVPLAIKVVGSLLYGQDKSKWLSFQEKGLSFLQESKNNDIMPILKLSFDQLESPIKSCFTYCALFPKDYELDVTQLKRLWMAQGYIVASNNGQIMEEAAEEYVSILVRRCFFQVVKYNLHGDIASCKIHDLMHDIALKVAEKEICIRNFTNNDVKKKTRHLAYTSSELAQLSFTETQLRSCLYVGKNVHDPKMYPSTSHLDGLLSNWMGLRVLDLKYLGIECLPESIGKLLHLRYLDIRQNSKLGVLPKSLIKLYNLQTLLLGSCMKLEELPKNFINLVNLRTLVIEWCGIKNLTCLGTLPHLKCLKLFWLMELEYIEENKGEVGGSICASTPDGRLMIAHGLLSFPCLEILHLVYLGKLKGWGNSRVEEIGDNSSSITPMLLPQLKTLVIDKCRNMKCKLLLPKLEVLDLEKFNESGLEINRLSEKTSSSSSSTTSSSSCYCYSLPKLKKVYIWYNVRWLKRMPVESFQCLEKLSIRLDEEIESIGEVGEVFRSCSSSLLSLEIWDCHKLRRVISGGLEYLSALESLKIDSCQMLSLSEEEEERQDYGIIGIGLPPCPRFLHSLRNLSLEFLLKMVNLPNWMHYLSALQTLEIKYCKGLETMPDWIANIPSIRISGGSSFFEM